MHFAVFGAGYTGQRVLRLLSASATAATVLATTRSGSNATDVACDHQLTSDQIDPDQNGSAKIKYLRLNLDQAADATIDLPAPCTLLYTIPPAEGTKDPRLSRLLQNIDGGLERMVYLSTTGVYGNRDGDLVTEEDTTQPTSERARRRVSAEQMLLQWCKKTGTELIILRVPGIYGPGRLGLERISAGEPSLFEVEANPGNRIHVDDLARCCVHAMTTSATPGIYNVGDGEHLTNTWFRKMVARLAELDTPPEISLAQARQTFSEMRMSFAAESRRIDTTKMRKVLGFTPRYTNPAEGIRASLIEQQRATSIRPQKT